MIKITNGVEVFEVSRGAFETIYKNQGFNELDGAYPNEVVNEVLDEEIDEVEDDIDEIDEVDEVETDDEKGKSDDEAFCDELMEKPIGQWKKKEIKRFCKVMNIDISKTESQDEAKEIIKKFLDE